MKSIEQKRKEAQARAEARSNRTPEQQLALLDKNRHEAWRERERLETIIAQAMVPVGAKEPKLRVEPHNPPNHKRKSKKK